MRIRTLLVVAVLCSAFTFAQNAPAVKAKAVAAKPAIPATSTLKILSEKETKLWDAWATAKSDYVKTTVSEDGINVSFTGAADKKQSIADIESGACKVKSYKFKDFKLSLFSPDMALLTYRVDQDAACGGQQLPPAVYASALYVKRGGKWLNAFHQETPAAN